MYPAADHLFAYALSLQIFNAFSWNFDHHNILPIAFAISVFNHEDLAKSLMLAS